MSVLIRGYRLVRANSKLCDSYTIQLRRNINFIIGTHKVLRFIKLSVKGRRN